MKKRITRILLAAGIAALALALPAGLLGSSGIADVYGQSLMCQITAQSANTAYGTVTGSNTYDTGAPVTLTATPNAGYRFVDWKDELARVASTDAVYSFTAETDRTLTATFAAIGTPTLSTAVSGGYDSVKLTWTAATGGTGYEVYKSSSATGTYVKAGSTIGTSYTAAGLPAGKTTYFKVRAYATAGTTTTYGGYSGVKSAIPLPGTPSLTAASASYTSIKLSWAAVPGSGGYQIYRSTTATGTYALVTTTTSATTSYTNSGLVTGKTYYYKIRAFHTEGTTKVYSAYSAVKYTRPIPSTPALSAATKTSTSATVKWTAAAGATKYQVYRKTGSTGIYALVYTAAGTTTTWVNTGLTAGKDYYYKVRAYHTEGTLNVYGNFSTETLDKQGSCYYTGVYLVGRDLPAGEYLIYPTDAAKAGFTVTKDAAGTSLISAGTPVPERYATFTTGQYVTLTYCKAYPLSFAATPKVALDSNGNLLSGQYKVGRDIPAGTYVLMGGGTGATGYLYIEANSLNLNSGIVGATLFRGQCYVTVTTGQYLTFKGDWGMALERATPADTSGGTLPSGMYLAGRDIPAGSYTLSPGRDAVPYYYILSDAKHNDASVISYQTFDTDVTVELEEGQYLLVMFGTVKLPS